MRLSRLRKDPLGWMLVTLAANRCIRCGRAKEWFRRHHCKGCLRTLKG
jgi:hypothetical protein